MEAMRGGRPPPAADAGWWFRAPRLAATLSHTPSGRTMEVLTNAPAMQVYSSNFLDASAPMRGTKEGAVYGRYGGLCLETQSFPNGASHADDKRSAAAVGTAAAAGASAAGAAAAAGSRPQRRRGDSMSSRRMGAYHDKDAYPMPQRVAYPSGVLRPGEKYRHTTVYRFSTSK